MVLTLVTVVLLAGCSPVITSSGDYRTAAARTAGDASAAVATAALAAQLGVDDRATTEYLAVVAGGAEDSLAGIEGTFASLQPPEADVSTRAEVLDLLSQADDAVSAVRIAVTRGDPPPADAVEQLQDLQDEFDSLAGELTGQTS